MIKTYKIKHIHIGKLGHNEDLLNSIQKICEEKSIRMGIINLIGAVKKATIAYYHQGEYEYKRIVIDQPLEILNCIGNISIKDASPFVHCHITLADEKSQTWGGHLMPGTIIFAAEFALIELEGEEMIRGFDPVTKLSLWKE